MSEWGKKEKKRKRDKIIQSQKGGVPVWGGSYVSSNEINPFVPLVTFRVFGNKASHSQIQAAQFRRKGEKVNTYLKTNNKKRC